MKYKGIELNEFTSDRPVLFDPPKKMLVWSFGDLEPCERTVMAYVPGRTFRSVIAKSDEYSSCAEIPEQPESRRATNIELAKWLARGNGIVLRSCEDLCSTTHSADVIELYDECPAQCLVRKWDDEEWHVPTADYMGLEG